MSFAERVERGCRTFRPVSGKKTDEAPLIVHSSDENLLCPLPHGAVIKRIIFALAIIDERNATISRQYYYPLH